MSFPPPHVPIIPPMPFLPPGGPMMMPIVPPANGTHRPGENEKKNKFQVPTTVFVGSISDRAPDVMIKRMLQNCGSVINWKRVQGANGKLQAFGFCEYENPEGTLRCIRLLNNWQIQDKNLVVKVDAKTKVLLDEYKKKKRQELAKKAANDTTAFKFIYEDDEEDGDGDGDETKTKKTNSSEADGKKKSGEEGEIEEEEDDYLDEATRREDHAIRQSLETIMREYSREMNQRALEQREAAAREAQAAAAAMPPAPPMSTSSPPADPNSMSPGGKRIDSNVSIDDEEGKRSLITNEIQMFRDRFKDEDTKMRNTERERKDRYERERALQREKRLVEETTTSNVSPSSRDASPPSSRDRSSPPPPRRNRRDRSSPSDDRYRNSSSRNNNSNSVRSRNNDRRSSPSNRYERRSSPPPPSRSYNRRSRTKSPIGRAHSDDGDDDETYERKKQEKRLKEKEARYRDRLKAWTQRERKKQTDYKNEKERELTRVKDEEKEGKRLLAFLEEYKDEVEDSKHYKGNGLVRRLKDREHEIELDNRDRRHEKEEIEELRQKLLQENVSDVEGEIKRRLEKEEEQIRRRLADLIRASSDESADDSDNDVENVPTKLVANSEPISSRPATKIDSPKVEPKLSPKQVSALGGAPISGTKIPSKRKLAVNEAFRDDQDDENNSSFQKKSKLSAIPEPVGQPSPTTTPVKNAAVAAAAAAATNAQSAQIQEEKRQAVKKLIESIPTKKEDLFTFPLDWSLLDTSLMEKRIKPWVTKKIVEYIGEEEASLTDFICASIMAKNNAEKILSDIRLVLDDEAEVFVVKMWRLIVYEIEAKRQGLSK